MTELSRDFDTARCRFSPRSSIPRRRRGLETRMASSRSSCAPCATYTGGRGSENGRRHVTLELEVALAYLRSRPSRLVSAVSLLSISGIALGVAALVVSMGLLSGYRTEIREKLI